MFRSSFTIRKFSLCLKYLITWWVSSGKRHKNPFTSDFLLIAHRWLSGYYLLLISRFQNKMAAVFCMGELESENEVSPFSLEQLEMKDLTTVFSCDVEEIINVQQKKNITVLMVEQFRSRVAAIFRQTVSGNWSKNCMKKNFEKIFVNFSMFINVYKATTLETMVIMLTCIKV